MKILLYAIGESDVTTPNNLQVQQDGVVGLNICLVLTNAQFVDMSKYVSGLKSTLEDGEGPSQGFTDAHWNNFA